MSDVAVSVKIYVSDPKKLGDVKDAISKFAKVQYSKEEELGFGIKILRITLILQDEEGGVDNLEKQISSIPEVSQVEIETATRV